eukprot:146456_1
MADQDMDSTSGLTSVSATRSASMSMDVDAPGNLPLVSVEVIPEDPQGKVSQHELEIEENMTYTDLMDILRALNMNIGQNYAFYSGREEEDLFGNQKYRMEDLVLPSEEIGTVYLRPDTVSITVCHRGESVSISVSPHHCLADIREAFQNLSQGREKLDQVSWRGKPVREEDSMQDLGIIDNPSDPLVGQLVIHVRDEKAQLDNQMAVYDFCSVNDVLKEFCKAEKRSFREKSQLLHNGKACDAYDSLHSLQPVLKHDDVLYFDAHAYVVEIKDFGDLTEYDVKDREKVMLTVEDHWTVKKLKEVYSQRPEVQPLLDGDQFHFEDQPLADDQYLLRIGLTDNSEVYVERAEETVAHAYRCADCGADVNLKPQDAVRCRVCFFRIVFKKRTARVCQYNCR